MPQSGRDSGVHRRRIEHDTNSYPHPVGAFVFHRWNPIPGRLRADDGQPVAEPHRMRFRQCPKSPVIGMYSGQPCVGSVQCRSW